MAEFVGGEPISVGVDEPITFENKIDTDFDVGYGIVFRKSGLYRVSIVGRHTSVAVEPERKKGRWIHDGYDIPHGVDWIHCSECGRREPNVPAAKTPYCPECGARLEGAEQDG